MMVLQGTTNGGTTKMSSLRLPLVALFLRLVCVCYTLAAALPVTTLEVAEVSEDSNTGMLNAKSNKVDSFIYLSVSLCILLSNHLYINISI